jgi:RimJ/RimL family protein N-acetyltransferase
VAKPLELPTMARFGVELRPWRLTDAPALRDACGDEEIMRFTTIPGVFTEEAATDWINRQRQHAERATAMVLAVIDAGERFPVGMVGLFGLDRGDHTARLGYWLLNHARGRGLATAAARGLTDWAFDHLGLNQVIIDREPTNLASARGAEKLGARETGACLVGLPRLRGGADPLRHSPAEQLTPPAVDQKGSSRPSPASWSTIAERGWVASIS